eukprot:tig00021374_g21116.t1
MPDALLGGVFRALGLRESWLLRGVCRRWRRVVEETEWPGFEMWRDENGHEPDRGAHETAAALVEDRRLRLGGGAGVVLGPDWRELAAACRLLAAFARSRSRSAAAGGSRGAAPAAAPAPATAPLLREVVVRVLGPEYMDEHGFAEGYGPDFLSAYLLGALGALRPQDTEPEAEGAPAPLEGLHLSLANARRSPLSIILPPPAAELRAALAPFGGLRSLSLCFPALDNGMPPEVATAIAAACPLLRSLGLRPKDGSESAALAALAPLARLERLALAFRCQRGEVSEGVAALAAGPAGRSLRRLLFLNEAKLRLTRPSSARPRPDQPGQPRLASSAPAPALLQTSPRLTRPSSASSASLPPPLSRPAPARLLCQPPPPRLASSAPRPALIRPLFRSDELARLAEVDAAALRPHLRHFAGVELSDAALAALGRMPRLESLGPLCLVLRVEGSDAAGPNAALLPALAEALSCPPNLSALRLELNAREASPEDVVGLLRRGGRRALTELDLRLGRPLDAEEEEAGAPLSVAEAEAIAALPALRRLYVAVTLEPYSRSALRPFEVLARLGPEVSVRINVANVSEFESPEDLQRARDPIDRLLAGRRPYP